MNEIEKAIALLKKNDPILKDIIQKHGPCLLQRSDNYFRDLVSTIISQQLSIKAYLTIEKRLFDKLNNKITPKNILALPDEDIKSCGLSLSKTKFIKNVATFSQEKPTFFKNIDNLSDEEITNELIKIKGIGVWSTQMFLIFNLNRLDIFPLNDGGIRRAISLNYKFKGDITEDKILKITKKWGNYKTIATWYLWRSLDNK